ncbi:MAG TPA: DUF192 domain-containing protein [Phycisphaerales bacterium]|nr:DUF192 domain-containing protein [Phycisphaerales bacterium]
MAQIVRALAVLVIGLVPALLGGCDEKAAAGVAPVKVSGKTFFLEIADTDAKRFQGLSGRDHIEDDGGMLFVFPFPAVQNFVMRDCRIPIDILYLDGGGRVLTTHEMQPDPPRGPGEGKPGELSESYEARLKKYPSRYPAQFVIELKGGSIRALKVAPGDLVELDAAGLKKLAK